MTPDQLRARAKRIDDGYLASAEDAQALREYADLMQALLFFGFDRNWPVNAWKADVEHAKSKKGQL